MYVCVECSAQLVEIKVYLIMLIREMVILRRDIEQYRTQMVRLSDG